MLCRENHAVQISEIFAHVLWFDNHSVQELTYICNIEAWEPKWTMVCKRLNYLITCWPLIFVSFAKVLIFVGTCAEDQWQAGVITSLKNQPLMISKHFLTSVTSWCFKLAGDGFALRWWLEAVRTNGGVKPSAWEVLYLSTPAIECKCSDSGTIACSGLEPIVCKC